MTTAPKLWRITDKGDPRARYLVDHGVDDSAHYSRQTRGAAQWTRNGENIVLLSVDELAVWATHRPSPGKAVRPDGRDAWECTLFRNCGTVLSSELIREAAAVTFALWTGGLGDPLPIDGLITYVKPSAIRSPNPGYCYKRAGWTKAPPARDGKPCFRAPEPESIEDWRAWEWVPGRGGKLRLLLETKAGLPASQLEMNFKGAA